MTKKLQGGGEIPTIDIDANTPNTEVTPTSVENNLIGSPGDQEDFDVQGYADAVNEQVDAPQYEYTVGSDKIQSMYDELDFSDGKYEIENETDFAHELANNPEFLKELQSVVAPEKSEVDFYDEIMGELYEKDNRLYVDPEIDVTNNGIKGNELELYSHLSQFAHDGSHDYFRSDDDYISHALNSNRPGIYMDPDDPTRGVITTADGKYKAFKDIEDNGFIDNAVGTLGGVIGRAVTGTLKTAAELAEGSFNVATDFIKDGQVDDWGAFWETNEYFESLNNQTFDPNTSIPEQMSPEDAAEYEKLSTVGKFTKGLGHYFTPETFFNWDTWNGGDGEQMLASTLELMIPGTLAMKAAGKAKLLSIGGKVGGKLDDIVKASKGAASQFSRFEQAGNALGGYLAYGATSGALEARMEAQGTYNAALEAYSNPESPRYIEDELERKNKAAGEAADHFTTGLPLLVASNMVEGAATFLPFAKLKSVGSVGKLSYMGGAGVANMASEGIEELGQYSIEKYITEKYRGNDPTKQYADDSLADKWGNIFTEGVHGMVDDPEAMKSFVGGMTVGGMFSTVSTAAAKTKEGLYNIKNADKIDLVNRSKLDGNTLFTRDDSNNITGLNYQGIAGHAKMQADLATNLAVSSYVQDADGNLNQDQLETMVTERYSTMLNDILAKDAASENPILQDLKKDEFKNFLARELYKDASLSKSEFSKLGLPKNFRYYDWQKIMDNSLGDVVEVAHAFTSGAKNKEERGLLKSVQLEWSETGVPELDAKLNNDMRGLQAGLYTQERLVKKYASPVKKEDLPENYNPEEYISDKEGKNETFYHVTNKKDSKKVKEILNLRSIYKNNVLQTVAAMTGRNEDITNIAKAKIEANKVEAARRDTAFNKKKNKKYEIAKKLKDKSLAAAGVGTRKVYDSVSGIFGKARSKASQASSALKKKYKGDNNNTATTSTTPTPQPPTAPDGNSTPTPPPAQTPPAQTPPATTPPASGTDNAVYADAIGVKVQELTDKDGNIDAAELERQVKDQFKGEDFTFEYNISTNTIEINGETFQGPKIKNAPPVVNDTTRPNSEYAAGIKAIVLELEAKGPIDVDELQQRVESLFSDPRGREQFNWGYAEVNGSDNLITVNNEVFPLRSTPEIYSLTINGILQEFIQEAGDRFVITPQAREGNLILEEGAETMGVAIGYTVNNSIDEDSTTNKFIKALTADVGVGTEVSYYFPKNSGAFFSKNENEAKKRYEANQKEILDTLFANSDTITLVIMDPKSGIKSEVTLKESDFTPIATLIDGVEGTASVHDPLWYLSAIEEGKRVVDKDGNESYTYTGGISRAINANLEHRRAITRAMEVQNTTGGASQTVEELELAKYEALKDKVVETSKVFVVTVRGEEHTILEQTSIVPPSGEIESRMFIRDDNGEYFLIDKNSQGVFDNEGEDKTLISDQSAEDKRDSYTPEVLAIIKEYDAKITAANTAPPVTKNITPGVVKGHITSKMFGGIDYSRQLKGKTDKANSATDVKNIKEDTRTKSAKLVDNLDATALNTVQRSLIPMVHEQELTGNSVNASVGHGNSRTTKKLELPKGYKTTPGYVYTILDDGKGGTKVYPLEPGSASEEVLETVSVLLSAALRRSDDIATQVTNIVKEYNDQLPVDLQFVSTDREGNSSIDFNTLKKVLNLFVNLQDGEGGVNNFESTPGASIKNVGLSLNSTTNNVFFGRKDAVTGFGTNATAEDILKKMREELGKTGIAKDQAVVLKFNATRATNSSGEDVHIDADLPLISGGDISTKNYRDLMREHYFSPIDILYTGNDSVGLTAIRNAILPTQLGEPAVPNDKDITVVTPDDTTLPTEPATSAKVDKVDDAEAKKQAAFKKAKNRKAKRRNLKSKKNNFTDVDASISSTTSIPITDQIFLDHAVNGVVGKVASILLNSNTETVAVGDVKASIETEVNKTMETLISMYEALPKDADTDLAVFPGVFDNFTYNDIVTLIEDTNEAGQTYQTVLKNRIIRNVNQLLSAEQKDDINLDNVFQNYRNQMDEDSSRGFDPTTKTSLKEKLVYNSTVKTEDPTGTGLFTQYYSYKDIKPQMVAALSSSNDQYLDLTRETAIARVRALGLPWSKSVADKLESYTTDNGKSLVDQILVFNNLLHANYMQIYFKNGIAKVGNLEPKTLLEEELETIETEILKKGVLKLDKEGNLIATDPEALKIFADSKPSLEAILTELGIDGMSIDFTTFKQNDTYYITQNLKILAAKAPNKNRNAAFSTGTAGGKMKPNDFFRSKAFNAIADLRKKAQGLAVSINLVDNNKSVGTYIAPSALATSLAKFKNQEADERANEFGSVSANPEEMALFKFANSMQYGVAALAHKVDPVNPTKYSDLEAVDADVSQMQYFFGDGRNTHAYYVTATPSDGGTNIILNFKRNNFNSISAYTPAQKKYMFDNMIQPDLNRIRTPFISSTALKTYDPIMFYAVPELNGTSKYPIVEGLAKLRTNYSALQAQLTDGSITVDEANIQAAAAYDAWYSKDKKSLLEATMLTSLEERIHGTIKRMNGYGYFITGTENAIKEQEAAEKKGDKKTEGYSPYHMGIHKSVMNKATVKKFMTASGVVKTKEYQDAIEVKDIDTTYRLVQEAIMTTMYNNNAVVLNNLQFIMQGDPAQYHKGARGMETYNSFMGNTYKRLKSNISTSDSGLQGVRTVNKDGSPGKVRTTVKHVIFKDNEVPSFGLESIMALAEDLSWNKYGSLIQGEITKEDYEAKTKTEQAEYLLANVDNMQSKVDNTAAYFETAQADAIEYYHYRYGLDFLEEQGKISFAKKQELVKKIENNTLEKSDYKYLTVLKPLHVGFKDTTVMVNGEAKKARTRVYIKSAAKMIFPQVVKGTQFEEIYKQMDKEDGPDVLTASSAIKVGGPAQPFNLFDDNGNYSGEALSGAAVEVLPTSGKGNQLNVKTDKDGNTALSTQVEKNLGADISELVFEDGTLMKDLIKEKEALQREQYNVVKQKLINKIAVDPNSPTPTVDIKKLNVYLQEELESRGFDQNAKDMIDIYEEIDPNGEVRHLLMYPLAHTPQANRFDALIASLVTKGGVANLKTSGFGIPQIPAAGIQTGETVVTGDGSSIVTVGDYKVTRGLKHYTEPSDGNKKGLAEIILPWVFPVPIDDFIKDGKLDTSMLPEEYLEGLGFRIPNQAYPSMMGFKIVGFTREANSLYVPHAIATQMGSDYDIDKMYGYLKAIKVQYKHDRNHPELKPIYDKIDAITAKSQKLNEAWLANSDLFLEGDLNLDEKQEQMNIQFDQVLTNLDKKELVAELQLLKEGIQKTVPTRFVEKTDRGSKIINELHDIKMKMISHPSVKFKSLEPLDAGIDKWSTPGGLVSIIDQLLKDENALETYTDWTYQSNKIGDGRVGKTGIGAFAVNASTISTMEGKKVRILPSYNNDGELSSLNYVPLTFDLGDGRGKVTNTSDIGHRYDIDSVNQLRDLYNKLGVAGKQLVRSISYDVDGNKVVDYSLVDLYADLNTNVEGLSDFLNDYLSDAVTTSFGDRLGMEVIVASQEEFDNHINATDDNFLDDIDYNKVDKKPMDIIKYFRRLGVASGRKRYGKDFILLGPDIGPYGSESRNNTIKARTKVIEDINDEWVAAWGLTDDLVTVRLYGNSALIEISKQGLSQLNAKLNSQRDYAFVPKPQVAEASDVVDTNALSNAEKYELMNDTQKEAVAKIEAFLAAPNDGADVLDQAFLLMGEGGTGKTFVSSYIKSKIAEQDKYSSIKVVAPTWNAVNELQQNAITFASLVGTQPYVDNDTGSEDFVLLSEQMIEDGYKNGKKLPAAYTEDYLIIDEASMLGGDGKASVETKKGLQSTDSLVALRERLDHRERMGLGKVKKIIFMGDYAQIPPVKGDDFKDAEIIETLVQRPDSHHLLTENMRTNNKDIQGVLGNYRQKIDQANTAVREGKREDIKDISPTFKGDRVESENVLYTKSFAETVDNFVELYENSPNNDNPYDVVWVNYNSAQRAETKKVNSAIRKALFGENVTDGIQQNELVYLDSQLLKAQLDGAKSVDFHKDNRFKISDITPVTNETISVGGGNSIKGVPVQTVTATTRHQGKIVTVKFKTTTRESLDKFLGPYKRDIKGYTTAAGQNIRYGDKITLTRAIGVLKPSYVVNGHKIQGSTYNNVIVDEANILKQPGNNKRKLQSVYTAVSRAKSKVIIHHPVLPNTRNNSFDLLGAPTGKPQLTYRELPVIYTDNIINAEGKQGTAQYDRANNTIKINKEKLKAAFEAKAWTNMRTLVEEIHGTKINNKTITDKQSSEIENLRQKEQVELLKEIPNAKNYLTNGKVDKEKITNLKDIAKFEKIYNKYDKLISPLLQSKPTQQTSEVEVTVVESTAENLPENLFQTYAELEAFVMEHEYQHSLYSRADHDAETENSTKGTYETAINNKALEQLGYQQEKEAPVLKKEKPTAIGYYNGSKIVLNKDAANIGTLVHEAAHPLIKDLISIAEEGSIGDETFTEEEQAQAKEVYDNLLEEAKLILDEELLWIEDNYPADKLNEEIIVRAIQITSNASANKGPSSFIKAMMNFLSFIKKYATDKFVKAVIKTHAVTAADLTPIVGIQQLVDVYSLTGVAINTKGRKGTPQKGAIEHLFQSESDIVMDGNDFDGFVQNYNHEILNEAVPHAKPNLKSKLFHNTIGQNITVDAANKVEELAMSGINPDTLDIAAAMMQDGFTFEHTTVLLRNPLLKEYFNKFKSQSQTDTTYNPNLKDEILDELISEHDQAHGDVYRKNKKHFSYNQKGKVTPKTVIKPQELYGTDGSTQVNSPRMSAARLDALMLTLDYKESISNRRTVNHLLNIGSHGGESSFVEMADTYDTIQEMLHTGRFGSMNLGTTLHNTPVMQSMQNFAEMYNMFSRVEDISIANGKTGKFFNALTNVYEAHFDRSGEGLSAYKRREVRKIIARAIPEYIKATSFNSIAQNRDNIERVKYDLLSVDSSRNLANLIDQFKEAKDGSDTNHPLYGVDLLDFFRTETSENEKYRLLTFQASKIHADKKDEMRDKLINLYSFPRDIATTEDGAYTTRDLVTDLLDYSIVTGGNTGPFKFFDYLPSQLVIKYYSQSEKEFTIPGSRAKTKDDYNVEMMETLSSIVLNNTDLIPLEYGDPSRAIPLPNNKPLYVKNDNGEIFVKTYDNQVINGKEVSVSKHVKVPNVSDKTKVKQYTVGQAGFYNALDGTMPSANKVAVENKSTIEVNGEVLNKVINETFNIPEFIEEVAGRNPELAEFYKAALDSAKIQGLEFFVDELIDSDPSIQGQYDRVDNTIVLSNNALMEGRYSAEEVIMHEMLHSMASDQVDLYEQYKKGQIGKEALGPELIKDLVFLDSVYDMYKLSYPGDLASQNLDEFISEFMRSEKIRDKVGAINPNLIQRIYETLKDIFNRLLTVGERDSVTGSELRQATLDAVIRLSKNEVEVYKELSTGRVYQFTKTGNTIVGGSAGYTTAEGKESVPNKLANPAAKYAAIQSSEVGTYETVSIASSEADPLFKEEGRLIPNTYNLTDQEFYKVKQSVTETDFSEGGYTHIDLINIIHKRYNENIASGSIQQNIINTSNNKNEVSKAYKKLKALTKDSKYLAESLKKAVEVGNITDKVQVVEDMMTYIEGVLNNTESNEIEITTMNQMLDKLVHLFNPHQTTDSIFSTDGKKEDAELFEEYPELLKKYNNFIIQIPRLNNEALEYTKGAIKEIAKVLSPNVDFDFDNKYSNVDLNFYQKWFMTIDRTGDEYLNLWSKMNNDVDIAYNKEIQTVVERVQGKVDSAIPILKRIYDNLDPLNPADKELLDRKDKFGMYAILLDDTGSPKQRYSKDYFDALRNYKTRSLKQAKKYGYGSKEHKAAQAARSKYFADNNYSSEIELDIAINAETDSVILEKLKTVKQRFALKSQQKQDQFNLHFEVFKEEGTPEEILDFNEKYNPSISKVSNPLYRYEKGKNNIVLKIEKNTGKVVKTIFGKKTYRHSVPKVGNWNNIDFLKVPQIEELYNELMGLLQEVRKVLPARHSNKLDASSLPFLQRDLAGKLMKDMLIAGNKKEAWENIKAQNLSKLVSSDKEFAEYDDNLINVSFGKINAFNRWQTIEDRLLARAVEAGLPIRTKSGIISPRKANTVKHSASGTSGFTPEFKKILNEVEAEVDAELSDYKSYDLGKIALTYYAAAMQYKHKSQAVGDMNLIKNRAMKDYKDKDFKGKKEVLEANDKMLKGIPVRTPWGKMDQFLDKRYDVLETKRKKDLEGSIEALNNKMGELKENLVKTTDEKEKKNLQNQIKKYENIIDAKKNEIENLGGYLYAGNLIRALLNFNTLRVLGFNIKSFVGNLTAGFFANMLEAADGRIFNMDSYKKMSKKIYLQSSLTPFMFGTGAAIVGSLSLGLLAGGAAGIAAHQLTKKFAKPDKDAEKTLKLMSRYDILQKVQDEVRKSIDRAQADTIGGLANKGYNAVKNNAYIFITNSETPHQATILGSMIDSTKVIHPVSGKEVSFFQLLDNNGNVKHPGNIQLVQYDAKKNKVLIEKDATELLDKLASTATAIIAKTHGNYRSNTKQMAKHDDLAVSATSFKTWAFEGYYNRFEQEKVNRTIEQDLTSSPDQAYNEDYMTKGMMTTAAEHIGVPATIASTMFTPMLKGIIAGAFAASAGAGAFAVIGPLVGLGIGGVGAKYLLNQNLTKKLDPDVRNAYLKSSLRSIMNVPGVNKFLTPFKQGFLGEFKTDAEGNTITPEEFLNTTLSQVDAANFRKLIVQNAMMVQFSMLYFGMQLLKNYADDDDKDNIGRKLAIFGLNSTGRMMLDLEAYTSPADMYGKVEKFDNVFPPAQLLMSGYSFATSAATLDTYKRKQGRYAKGDYKFWKHLSKITPGWNATTGLFRAAEQEYQIFSNK